MELIALFALLVLLGAVLVADAAGSKWLLGHRQRAFLKAQRMWQRLAETAPLQWLKRRFPGAWSFVGKRLTTSGYLGVHFTIGMLLSIAALVGFALVAWNVFRVDRLVRVDREFVEAVRGPLGEEMVPVFKAFTIMGNGGTILLVGLALLILLAVRKKRSLLIGWTVGVLGAWTLETGLKLIFRRTRPDWAFIDLPTSFSFPSGHALVSLVTYGMLAYLVWRQMKTHRARMITVGVAIVLITLIGFSRVYLGVHYFSDVMAGYAAGLTWLFALISGLEMIRRRTAHRALRPSPEATAPAT